MEHLLRKLGKLWKKFKKMLIASIKKKTLTHNLNLIHITSTLTPTPSINLQQFYHPTNFQFIFMHTERIPKREKNEAIIYNKSHSSSCRWSDKKSEKDGKKIQKKAFHSPYFQQHQQRDDSTSSRTFADVEWLLSYYCHLIDCCFCYWQHSNCIRAELTGMS